jgi:hypothetical protein
MTSAAFTAGTTISGNTIVVDRLGNYVTVAPAAGLSTGDVDSLSIDLAALDGSLVVGPVATITASQAVTLELALAGPLQVAAAFFDSSLTTQVTLSAGASSRIWLLLSPSAAGHGSGTLRLSVAGSSWLYREYALGAAAVPGAPSSLDADAHGHRISLDWSPSQTTTGLGGYAVYRSSGGSYSRIASVSSGTTAYEDDSVAKHTTYSYRVRAFASDDSRLESGDSPTATATSA